MRSLVVGIGDWERGDHAAALEVVRRIAEAAPDGVTTLAWEGSPLDLIDRWSGFDRVVLVCPGGGDVGRIAPLRSDPGDAAASVASDPDVTRALALAEHSGRLPPRFETAAIGVGAAAGARDGTPAGMLTPAVARAARQLAERIRGALADAVPLALDAPPPRAVPGPGTLAVWSPAPPNEGPQLAVEEAVRRYERADRCVAFVTGEAAVRAILHVTRSEVPRVVAVLEPGSVAARTLEAHAADVRHVAPDDVAAIEAAIDDGLDQLWLTTPVGPQVRVLDLQRLTRRASGEGAFTVVDVTGAGPVPVHPLAHGADLLVHADVAALVGASPLARSNLGERHGGLVAGDAELVAQVDAERLRIDGRMRPGTAERLFEGFRTLPLRAERRAANALAVARYLKRHARVRDVAYPGLSMHPDHGRVPECGPARWGPTLAFTADVEEPALELLERLRWVRCSMTGVHPDGVASECTPQGAGEGAGRRFRLICGIEDVDDLIDDLEAALGGR